MLDYGYYFGVLCNRCFSGWYVCAALLMFIPIESRAQTIDKPSSIYLCVDNTNSGFVHNYVLSKQECFDYSFANEPVCESSKSWGSIVSNISDIACRYDSRSLTLGSFYSNNRGSRCPYTHPIDNGDGTCSNDEPVSILCSDPQVQKDIQQAQYVCQLGHPSDMFFENQFQWSCTENPAPQYPNVSTTCSLIPKDCIQGLTCEKPSDEPYCNPANEECALPPPTPDLNPDDSNIPNPDPTFCELHPTLCESPTRPPITPEPNPSPGSNPTPDNPAMSVGENAVNKEMAESNQHLENINHNIKELDKRVVDQIQKANELAQHQLGELKEIRKKPTGGGSAGTTQAISEGNKKLDDIACLLDDGCESEGKEKPTANVDCNKSIFKCKGDVIQCAMLKVQYENTCTVDELNKLEAAFSKVVSVDNEAMLVQNDVVDFSKLDTTYLDNGVSFGVSATCPVPQTFSLEGKTIEFSFEPACHYAELVRPLVIFSAWLTGLLLIGRSQGMV